MDPNNDLEVEFLPFVRIYKSGRVERVTGTEIVPASVDPATGVASKDVDIDPDTGVSARLFLPNVAESHRNKLPILVYYHGGAFIIESPFSPLYHSYATTLVAKAGVLVVSVSYRRAPEHPLPAAYDDSWAALQWVASQAAGGSEAWLAEHGDFERVFLAGDSAGANIAHHTALRAGAEGLGPGGARIEGVALVHPYFWGRDPVGSETTDPGTRGWVEALWRLACPGTVGADDPMINPMAEGAPSLAGNGMAGRRVMVSVAEMDLLRERGRWYCEELVKSRWGGEAELHETEGEGHVFHLLNPTSEKALAEMERMVAFLNRE